MFTVTKCFILMPKLFNKLVKNLVVKMNCLNVFFFHKDVQRLWPQIKINNITNMNGFILVNITLYDLRDMSKNISFRRPSVSFRKYFYDMSLRSYSVILTAKTVHICHILYFNIRAHFPWILQSIFWYTINFL